MFTWKLVSRVARRTPSLTMRYLSTQASAKISDLAVSTANINPFRVQKS